MIDPAKELEFGRKLCLAGSFEESITPLKRAYEGFQALGRPELIALAATALADSLFHLRQYRDATSLYLDSLRYYETQNAPDHLAYLLLKSGTTFRILGYHLMAIRQFERLDAHSASRQMQNMRAIVNDALGMALMLDNQPDLAMPKFECARTLFHEQRQIRRASACILSCVRCTRLLGDYDLAGRLAEEAYLAFRSDNQFDGMASSKAEMGYCAAMRGSDALMDQHFAESRLLVHSHITTIGDSLEIILDRAQPHYTHSRQRIDAPSLERLQIESDHGAALVMTEELQPTAQQLRELMFTVIPVQLLNGGLFAEAAIVSLDLMRAAGRVNLHEIEVQLQNLRAGALSLAGTPTTAATEFDNVAPSDNGNSPDDIVSFAPIEIIDGLVAAGAKSEDLDLELHKQWRNAISSSEHPDAIENCDRVFDLGIKSLGGWNDDIIESTIFPTREKQKSATELFFFRTKYAKASALANQGRRREAIEELGIFYEYLHHTRIRHFYLEYAVYFTLACTFRSILLSAESRFDEAKVTLQNAKRHIHSLANSWLIADWWLARMRIARFEQHKLDAINAATEMAIVLEDLVKHSRCHPGELGFASHIQYRFKEAIDTLLIVGAIEDARRICALHKMFRLSVLGVESAGELHDWFKSKAREDMIGCLRMPSCVSQSSTLRRMTQNLMISTPEMEFGQRAQVGSPVLQSGEAIAEFHIGEGCTCIFVTVAGTPLQSVNIPLNRDAIADYFSGCRNALHKYTPADLRMIWDLFLSKFNWLIRYFKINRLYLIPSGELYQIPLHAAVDAAGQHLFEKVELSYLPRKDLLSKLGIRNGTIQSGLLISNPRGGIDTLPMTPLESRQIADLLEGPKHILFGKSVTIENILPQWHSCDVIVMSAHGQSREASGLLSHIQMSGSGVLTAADILWGLPSLKSGAVVLANCCNTGRLDRRDLDETLGFAISLLIRGASTVVANMWDINDIAGVVFSHAFVSALIAQRTTGIAYRQAIQAIKAFTRENALILIEKSRQQLQLWNLLGDEEDRRLRAMTAALSSGAALETSAEVSATRARFTARKSLQPIDFGSPDIWAPFMLMGRL